MRGNSIAVDSCIRLSDRSKDSDASLQKNTKNNIFFQIKESSTTLETSKYNNNNNTDNNKNGTVAKIQVSIYLLARIRLKKQQTFNE